MQPCHAMLEIDGPGFGLLLVLSSAIHFAERC